MKKIYHIPSANVIILSGESEMLNSVSQVQVGTGTTDEQDTRKQDFINSPWDNWNE